MAAPMKRALKTDSEVPSKIAKNAASDDKLNTFLQWCNGHQFNISPKVCVERERACAQYGMMAAEDIVAGETLFHVPRSCLLCPQNSGISELLEQAQDEMSGSRWVPLVLALSYEYNNPRSTWRPYLDLVPDFSELDLPMFWDSADCQQLLKGTGVDEAVTQDLTLMEKDFSTKALPFMRKHPEVFSEECLDFKFYQRMVAFVMAYSFTEPSDKTAGVDGKGECSAEDSDDDEEDTGIAPPPMMVPLADILNHVAKNNAALNFDKDELRMVSTRDIKKGEEVFNTYGELANKHLLHMYGFAECYPENHYDTVEIPVSVVTGVAELECKEPELLAQKLHFLQEQDLHQPGESYVVGREGVLTDDELQAVLKVLVMTENQFKEHAEKEGWSDAENDLEDGNSSPLSFENIPSLPQSWKDILSRCANICLSCIVGDAQKDAVAMETKGRDLSSRERYALFVRYGQRDLLQKLVDACR